MKEQKFYLCKICGNMVGMIHASGAPLTCCGEEMTELIPNTVDASHEKHVPAVELNGDLITVTVGAVEHPMTEAHHIEWIYLQTENGGQRKILKVDEPPKAIFSLAGETPGSVYAYCNLHGLWKKSQ